MKTIFTLLPGKPVEIHKQLRYHGSDAITDDLANRRCALIEVDKLLHELNSIVGTAYTLDTPSLRGILQTCVEKDYDLGMAYGYLRPRWLLNFSKFAGYMKSYESDDKAMRETALQGDHIVNPNLPPRRVWDLYSNRVLPSWVTNSWVVERQL